MHPAVKWKYLGEVVAALLEGDAEDLLALLSVGNVVGINGIGAEWLLHLRERINRLIREAAKG